MNNEFEKCRSGNCSGAPVVTAECCTVGRAAPRFEDGSNLRRTLLEQMVYKLFTLHDLNGNGFLEVNELVQLNKKVAMLHYGKDVDQEAVATKYRTLFRTRLHPQSRPVPFTVFRRYVLEVLDGLDPDPAAQEMIVEQFVAEAQSARATFHCESFASDADKSFISKISFSSVADRYHQDRCPTQASFTTFVSSNTFIVDQMPPAGFTSMTTRQGPSGLTERNISARYGGA